MARTKTKPTMTPAEIGEELLFDEDGEPQDVERMAKVFALAPPCPDLVAQGDPNKARASKSGSPDEGPRWIWLVTDKAEAKAIARSLQRRANEADEGWNVANFAGPKQMDGKTSMLLAAHDPLARAVQAVASAERTTYIGSSYIYRFEPLLVYVAPREREQGIARALASSMARQAEADLRHLAKACRRHGIPGMTATIGGDVDRHRTRQNEEDPYTPNRASSGSPSEPRTRSTR